MKRSEINQIISNSIQYLNNCKFYLPEWAKWRIADWQKNKDIAQEVFRYKLGWDVTDNGGTFATDGMILFTIRNGEPGQVKSYCEKIIIMDPDQVCPFHHHIQKAEDIINRSEHDVIFNIHNAKNKKADISISIDSIQHQAKADEDIILHSGQSLTLFPFYTHSFRPKNQKVLIGEVSTVNDDNTDNYFLNNDVARFPSIEEDEPIHYLLVNDYQVL